MEVRGVHPLYASYLEVGSATHCKKVRTRAVRVGTKVLTHPPHVALTINCAFALDREVMNLIELPELPQFDFASGSVQLGSPLILALASLNCAIDRERDVVQSTNAHRHHMEGVMFRDVNLLVLQVSRPVSSDQGIVQGQGVDSLSLYVVPFLLIQDLVLNAQSTEVSDVKPTLYSADKKQ